MDLLKSLEILREAQTRLRSLMETALGEHRYGDLADIAPLAEGLANLLSTSSGTQVDETALPVPLEKPVATKSERPSPARKTIEYPYFLRDGDKLVKVGWTKKDKREYEHRAPKEVVFKMAAALNARSPGSLVTMDSLLPLTLDDATNAPSYQAYLALAWFRAEGVVVARGKEGYAFEAGALDSKNIQRLWKELKAKKSP